MTSLPLDEAGALEPPVDACTILARLLPQRIDVGDDVLDGVLTHEHVRDRVHLVAIKVLGVAAAPAGLEVPELPFEVPVAHAGEPRSVRAPAALPFGPMTRRARKIQRTSALDVAGYCVGRRVVRQGRDVGEHILARRYIRDDVGHRYHPRAGVRRIVGVRSAADARLVVDQLPTDVPRVEARELR